MVQLSVSESDLTSLQSQDVDDLYAQLYTAYVGTSPDAGEALDHLSTLQMAIAPGAAAAEAPWDWLKEQGEKLFNSLWPSVKGVICQMYKEANDTDKDWIKKAAAAVLAAINVTVAVAVLIVTIAIKAGLNWLCSAQGADR